MKSFFFRFFLIFSAAVPSGFGMAALLAPRQHDSPRRGREHLTSGAHAHARGRRLSVRGPPAHLGAPVRFEALREELRRRGRAAVHEDLTGKEYGVSIWSSGTPPRRPLHRPGRRFPPLRAGSPPRAPRTPTGHLPGCPAGPAPSSGFDPSPPAPHEREHPRGDIGAHHPDAHLHHPFLEPAELHRRPARAVHSGARSLPGSAPSARPE